MEFKGYLSDKELQMIIAALNKAHGRKYPFLPQDVAMLIFKLKNRLEKYSKEQIEIYNKKFDTDNLSNF